MHRKKNHPILEEEPLIVDVKGTPVELKPKSRVVPIPVKTFSTALDLMKTPADMDAIPGLVMGFSDANSRIRDAQFEKMAREVNMNGRIDILMKLARGAGSNGFKFSRNVAREFMRGLKIQNSLPDKTIAIKALKNAETLLNLLGEARMKVNPDERLKRDPVVVGTLLSLFASTSSRFSGGKDYEGFTLMYAKRLQSCWEAVEWDQALVAGDKKSLWRAKFAVLNYKPVLEGLFQARDILQGSDIMPWVESESAKLNGTIGEWMKFLEENSDGENKMYGMHSYKEVAEKLAKELGVE